MKIRLQKPYNDYHIQRNDYKRAEILNQYFGNKIKFKITGQLTGSSNYQIYQKYSEFYRKRWPF